ncbi:MAG: hypothetical protein, partial [Olavius algarvensis Delta 4 endosymbiont]
CITILSTINPKTLKSIRTEFREEHRQPGAKAAHPYATNCYCLTIFITS